MSESPNHILRFQRARKYLEQLEAGIRDWLSTNYVVVTVPNDLPAYSVWAYAEPIPTEPFSLLIGDFLFNCRSGLDHLAFELAEAHTGELSDEVAEKSEFPIFGNADGKGASRFNRAAAKKLVAVNPAARAAIQGLQPFQRADWTSDPLWMLHELARIDRHRLLHLNTTHSEGLTLDPTKSANVQILPPAIEVFGGLIEGSAEIARLNLGPADPNKEMEVEFGAAPAVVFDAPLVANEPVVGTLMAIFNHLGRKVVNPLTAEFLGLLAMLLTIIPTLKVYT